MAITTPGQVVAGFRLPDSKGEEVALWHYKQRQPVVLVVFQGSDEPLLAGFAERYPEYRRLGAQVLAIGPDFPALDLPFPALRDAQGTTLTALSDQPPAVLVVDSYGELFTRLQGPAARYADHDDLLEWVFFTQAQCEECGPHAENWPRR